MISLVIILLQTTRYDDWEGFSWGGWLFIALLVLLSFAANREKD